MADKQIKRAALVFATTAISLLAVEIIASAMLFYRYRGSIPEIKGGSASSILMLAEGTVMGGKATARRTDDIVTRSEPSPLFTYDSVHGYSIKPGTYRISFHKTDSSNSKPFSYKATVLQDGSRFAGHGNPPKGRDTSKVFVFGDSFVFGSGVNDEQTFSYHLQQALPDRHVRLFATGGYSLSNAYLNFQRLGAGLNGNDVVILGYASFYGLRHVAAPSRLREYGSRLSRPHRSPQIKHVKVDIDESGKMTFGLVPLFCEDAGGYCDQKDPDKAYMDKVSARLINEIARATDAKVFLLHMMGEKSDPVLRAVDPSVTVVSVLPEDFEHEVNDQIMDYDNHPGPYWHHAVHTRLLEAMKKDPEAQR